CAADHRPPADLLGRPKDILGGVVGVDMGADEIDRHPPLGHMRKKRANPRRLRCRRSADPQAGTDALEIARGVIVKLEVAFLAGRAAPEIEIRLVPYLEIPLRNLIDAVA